jgi:serine/threonine protein kinase
LHKTEDQVIESLISTLDQQHLLINFGDLRIEDEVGRGVSSIVYCGKYNRGKGAKEETVAIKILHEKVIATEQAVDIFKEFFEREIAVLCKIEHENVLNLYGLAAHRGCLHIVTDYYPLTLDLLCRGTGGKPGSGSELIVWSEEMIQSLAVQLAKGMEHLHAQNIVHRDLKPANCLITANGSKLVLADFGLSKVLNEHYCSMTGQIGSPAFMANEMINDSLSNKVPRSKVLGSKVLDSKVPPRTTPLLRTPPPPPTPKTPKSPPAPAFRSRFPPAEPRLPNV